MDREESNDWKEWRRYVLEEIKRQNQNQESIKKDLHELKTSMTLLKFKSGMYGAIMGVIPAAIAAIVLYLKG